MRILNLALSAGTFAVVLAGAAQADLRFCNETDHVQSISIGYQGPEGWTSEGWWNVAPGECQTPVAGDLRNRYYYYRAEIDAGAFEGEGYFFCTTAEAYTIVGDTNCEARGYEQEDFREIDTGPTATDYTFTITAQTGGIPPAPGEDRLGLTFCNDTGYVQSVSIGYMHEGDWISEGWWNIEPDDCMTPLPGRLENRYYYYRAEIEGGEFDGQGYYFCTSPEAYTIVGDTDCAARGYDEEDFAEIDVDGYAGFTLTLVDDPGAGPSDGPAAPPAGERPEEDRGPTAEPKLPTFERKDAPRPPKLGE